MLNRWKILKNWENKSDGVYHLVADNKYVSNPQEQTNAAFSEKWQSFKGTEIDVQNKTSEFQKEWFLRLYGYESEASLKKQLSRCKVILDAGCGLGYKTGWFASLAPHATILAIDFSTAIYEAQKRLSKTYKNIIFARGDIAKTRIKKNSVDLVVCDQVIMHTESPKNTLKELSRIVSHTGSILCYWYRKKAVPRELLDEFFRSNVSNLTNKELWDLSKNVLELGKLLHELNVELDFPNIPALNIKGGKMDLQRFIYWNFIKCFWNSELGYETSLVTNFDWYSPANAKRFSKVEVYNDLTKADLEASFFHEEQACYSGRFCKKNSIRTL